METLFITISVIITVVLLSIKLKTLLIEYLDNQIHLIQDNIHEAKTKYLIAKKKLHDVRKKFTKIEDQCSNKISDTVKSLESDYVTSIAILKNKLNEDLKGLQLSLENKKSILLKTLLNDQINVGIKKILLEIKINKYKNQEPLNLLSKL